MRLFIKILPFICFLTVILTCWDCVKYKHITFLDIVLVVINSAGGILFAYLLYCDCLNFKNENKIWDVICNIAIYIGLSGLIYLFICGYINVINLYRDNYPSLSIILTLSVICSFLLYFLRKRFLLYSTTTSLIIYRITLLACITISTLLYLVLSVISCIVDYGIYNYVSLTTALISAYIVYLSFYHNFAYIIYRRSKYVLFLRNFAMDDQIREASLLSEIEGVCNKQRLFLMRIGNPKTIFDSSPGKTFYLKTVNWKEELQKHIKDAKLIFTVISYSDGLFWEIFNHVQYTPKFVYHILDISKMRDDLDGGRYDKIKHTKLGGILYFICSYYDGAFVYNKSLALSISFAFNDNYLIISCNVLDIVEYMFKQKVGVEIVDLTVLELEYDEDLKKEIIRYHDVKYLINDTNYYD